MKIFESKNLAIYLIFAVSIAVAFFLGYTAGEIQGENSILTMKRAGSVINTAGLQTAADNIDKSAERIAEIAASLDKLKTITHKLEVLSSTHSKNEARSEPVQGKKAANQAANIEQTSKTVRTTLSQETENLPKTIPSSGFAEKPAQEQTGKNREIAMVDRKSLRKMTDDIFLSDVSNKEKAIKTLARIASPEVKLEIGDSILNEAEDIGVRLAAIESIDWKWNAETLTSILQTDSSREIRQSLVYAARETDFNETEQQQIDQALFERYQQEPNDFVRLAILDYFSDDQAEKVEELLTLVSPEDFSDDVREHVKALQQGLP